MSDKAVARITRKLNREFRHNRLALFDEMNVVGIRKHIQKLYKKSYQIIKNEFVAILGPLYDEIYEYAVSLGFKGTPEELDENWIERYFQEYNPTTKQVFKNEIDRKRSYLLEAVVADPETEFESYAKAERLLNNQVKQCGIDLEDAVARSVYKDLGVKKVRWIAEDDYKTCDICNELDNQVFDIDDAPPKQHRNCRCYLIPVRD